MTASPGDGEHAAREGYYPDPSIPGYIRYWNGAAWVPGTSRPAPQQAPVAQAAPAPAPVAAPAAPVVCGGHAVRPDETGPVFLDETSMTEALPEPVPAPAHVAVAEPVAEPAVWQADPVHQAGFGGPRDHRVSWGSTPDPAPAAQTAPRPEPEPEPEPESEPSPRSAGISLARTAAAAAAPAAAPTRLPEQASAGILSVRSPAAQAPAWPDAPGAGGPGGSGLTSSWPEAVAPAPAPAPTPAPAPAPAPSRPRPAAPEAPAADRPEVWAPRPAGVRPRIAARPEAPAPAEARPEPRPQPQSREPHRADEVRPDGSGSRPAGARTPREVFERMAERAVRPAGLPRRAMARALDSLVHAAVAVAVARPLLPEATAHVEAKVDAARASGRTTTVWLLDGTIAGQLALVLGAVLLFGILYEVLPTARWGRTPGKKLLGVRVLATATLRPPTFGAALRRWLVYAFLGLPGSLWCLVDRPRRQAWHDKAARTYVAR
ncbi:putative RDD family membrane protein YckC [Streptomyces sp. CG 926]|uniref:RDD family protein n=1 Tax=Streptomyces sp. CG 926 TaxID=1882405 RepID=UPI000D6B11CA|nr:RDD family protein [Streptomyces sp. CG 926]PWK65569.1 putative RDD family membrane protein YckC [Streptomyces sp. CG 926]